MVEVNLFLVKVELLVEVELFLVEFELFGKG